MGMGSGVEGLGLGYLLAALEKKLGVGAEAAAARRVRVSTSRKRDVSGAAPGEVRREESVSCLQRQG